MKAQIHTFCNDMIIALPFGIWTIYGEIPISQMCYFTKVRNLKPPTYFTNELESNMAPIDQFEEFSIDHTHPEWKVRLSASLLSQLQYKILEIIVEFSHIFVWSPTNPGIIPRSLIEHKLHISPSAKLVTQKWHFFNTEKQAILWEEILDLLQADVIHRVQFSEWLANPIVVLKSGGKCHIFIDFTSLNKAIPKRQYSLPRTNMLADTTIGYSFLSFIDAHKC